MRRRLQSSWFLIALVSALAIGMGQAPRLVAFAESFPRLMLIGAIMFVTALPIDFAVMGRVAGAWWAVALAVVLNTIGTPLMGGMASFTAPPELAVGIVVATASPCTIASAAVWTRRGGGNDAVVVLVTLITNFASFVVMPLWVWAMLRASITIDAPGLAFKLLACVVAPIAAAQVLRRWRPVSAWTDRQKPVLSLAAQLGVLTIAFLGAIKSGATLRSMPTPISAVDWLIVVAATATVHTAVLAVGWRLARAAGMAPAESLAVALAGSQKTLAVGVGVALEFGGLAIFPMIIYHLGQLVIDTVFVDRVRRRTDRE